jgi:chemotaxis protein MotA
MEISTITGILLALMSLVIAFVAEGGHITALFAPTAALIVFGGTIGATLTSFSLKEMKTIPQLIRIIFFTKFSDEAILIEQIVHLAEKARREGLLYLENQLDQIENRFLRKGIQLVVDGTPAEMVRSILEIEVYSVQERHRLGAGIFETAGGYAPTMGIIGTVMGLVHVLANLSDPDRLGPSIAMAFLATLYGVSSANIFWLPISEKLKNLSKKEIKQMDLIVEGVMALQAGNSPILIRERLTAFLRPGRPKKEGGATGEEEPLEATN